MAKQPVETQKIGFRKYWFYLVFSRAIQEAWEYIKRDLAMALLIIVVAVATSILSANGLLDVAISNGYLSDASSLFRTLVALTLLSMFYLLFSIFYYPVILHRGQEKERDQLKKEIEGLKAEKDLQPILDNEEPKVINNQLPGFMIDNGLRYSPRMVTVSFFNKPKRKNESLTAKKVDARITYYDTKMKPILPNIVGRWDTKHEWESPNRESGIAIPPSKESSGLLEIDFEPNQDKKHTLVLAFWHVTDRYMYAVSSESFRYKNLRNPQYELKGTDFYIQIVLHPAYSDGIERWFLLSHNPLRGELEIKSVTNREINNAKKISGNKEKRTTKGRIKRKSALKKTS